MSEPESGVEGADRSRTGAERRSLLPRLVCQVCGRMLVPLKDGTARNHNQSRARYHEDYCAGSRHRLARWTAGQRLRHHGGSIWEVAEDRGGQWGDYLLRCVEGSRSFSDPEKWLEVPGKTMVAHGEYLHRDGWKPLPRDLMADLAASLEVEEAESAARSAAMTVQWRKEDLAKLEAGAVHA